MTKRRVCISWCNNGYPKERGFRVPWDDSWHARVRAAELKVLKTCDPKEGATVYSTSLDGETTEGIWTWDEESNSYGYHELG